MRIPRPVIGSRAACLAVLLLPVLRAEDYSYRRELFGTVGLGKAYDDEGSLGSGISGGGGAGVNAFLTRRFSLRPEFRVFSGSAGSTAVVEPPFVVLRVSLGAGYHW